MDKQKIKSVPRLTTDNPVDNFQTALNFTDVSEDGWVWLRQPEMALTEYARQLVKGHGSSIDLGCNDMELSESLTDHLFDDPKQSIDGLIAEHYTILWAYATLREKLKWYEDAGIPVIPNYGLSTIRRAINRYGTAPQLQMAIKEMSELTKAICNLQRAVTFNYRNGAKIKVAHESVREEIADIYIMLAQLVEIVGKPEEVQQIVLEKLEQLKVNDMRESKNHILPGGFAETQSADMLRAMEAVSAKMAAERGIKRVPLAVLSQSEVTRRMKSI